MAPTKLLGRRAEIDAIERLLESALAGRSGTLVLRGEAGIGKTALLGQARERSTPRFRVVECAGVEAEAHFAFAALHQLCAPLLDGLDGLPESQRLALGVALGVRTGPAPDTFLVALATLNLLTGSADAVPLVCVIDDSQWLDPASAQALIFVARRIAHERVAMIFASRDREPGEPDPLAGIEMELRLTGLSDSESRRLLALGMHAPLDEAVRDQIVAEARGNPLALQEFPRHGQLIDLAGGFESPARLSIPGRVEESFRLSSAGLSEDAQLFLLLAATDATGDAALLWRAADHAGLSAAAAGHAVESGLIDIETRVRFRHPLVRSAVYRAASPVARRRAHGEVAAATDPSIDPDRRTWHRSMSVVGLDEDVAAALESSAERTRARGGVAAAAVFLERATALTPDPAARARRALAAAHAKHDAGLSERAGQLASIAARGPLGDEQRGRLDLLRARIAFHLTQGGEVPGMLLAAAEKLSPLNPALARETYLHALDAALVIDASTAEAVATAAQSAPATPGRPTPPDLLLDALVTTFTQGYTAGAPAVRRALDAFLQRGFDGEALGEMGSRRWLWLATRTAAAFYDEKLGYVLAERNVRLAREAGALSTLPLSLVAFSAALVLRGDLPRAAEAAAEEVEVTKATGAVPLRYARLYIAAWAGREEETLQLFAASVESGHATLSEVGTAHYALSVLHNGMGRYSAAYAAAQRSDQLGELVNSSLTLPELVEAAVRADDLPGARTATAELAMRAAASGTSWALGLASRSHALTTSGADAEKHYLDAIDHLRHGSVAVHLARTHLVYGEWLRREGRRTDARTHLRTAHEMLIDAGAEAFAARAAQELRATGEHPRNRTSDPASGLTDHEQLIARLVADGATSREVGTQLFLSPRTIDAHLRNIYRKLGVSSRRQLAARMKN